MSRSTLRCSRTRSPASRVARTSNNGQRSLGNTWCDYACFDYPFGVSGITSAAAGGAHYAMGAYQTEFGFTSYEPVNSQLVSDSLSNIEPYGSSLVMGAQVPVPAAVWLFASGLGLFGFLRRRA